jgi:hypothetical protein
VLDDKNVDTSLNWIVNGIGIHSFTWGNRGVRIIVILSISWSLKSIVVQEFVSEAVDTIKWKMVSVSDMGASLRCYLFHLLLKILDFGAPDWQNLE